MGKKLSKEEQTKRNTIIKELEQIRLKYGTCLFRTCSNRILTIERQLESRRKSLKKVKAELEQLKKGKPIPQY